MISGDIGRPSIQICDFECIWAEIDATLLHEIKALQQITYLKLAWSFINVNPTKNAFFLTLINVTSA